MSLQSAREPQSHSSPPSTFPFPQTAVEASKHLYNAIAMTFAFKNIWPVNPGFINELTFKALSCGPDGF
jgi:hypothetical protein